MASHRFDLTSSCWLRLVVGTSGIHNILLGTSVNASVYGLGGNDRLFGGTGNDGAIIGSVGGKRLYGDDTFIRGLFGADRLLAVSSAGWSR